METTATITLANSETSRTRLKAFLELTKPRMNIVVVMTTLAGYYLSAQGAVDHVRLLLTLLGTAFAAAAASVLNQVMEHRFDALMPRTANRPLPAGTIRPSEACAFGMLLAVAGVALLAIDVNLLTAFLAAFTLLTYLLVYSPSKRCTTLCTLAGAVPGAIPVMMGCTAATGTITATSLILFLILCTWQIPHFLAIAILYRDDYAKGGFLVLPVHDNSLDVTSQQIVLYSLALLPVSIFPVAVGTVGWAYLIVAIVLNSALTACGLILVRTRRRQHARWLFVASLVYILCLLAAMVLGRSSV